jgi:hypothetical protein
VIAPKQPCSPNQGASAYKKRAIRAADKHLTKYFEGWIVATPDRRKFAVRITSYPEVDFSLPFDWIVTAAEVTERVRVPMED